MMTRWCLVALLVGCTSRYQPPARCPTPRVAADAVGPSRDPARATGDDPDEGDPLEDSARAPVAGAPRMGPARAPVTVVVFSDFECPYCARGRHIVSDLRTAFPESVRVVWRNHPLARHANAGPAAEAAMEVFAQRGHAAFWRFHDLLFIHQERLTRADLERYAQRVGADVAGLRRALDEGTHRESVEADMALAQRLEITGTPAFVVNGTVVQGAQPFAVFETLVLQNLARAARVPDARQVYRLAAEDPLPAPARPSAPGARPRNTWDRVWQLPPPATAPTLGPAEAPVTIQVFSDFQCPFCGHLEDTMRAVRAHYGDRVRVVWRDYPLSFHAFAMPAAEAAREAWAQRGNEGFWAFHALLFAHQRDDGGLSRPALERYARQVGLDLPRFRQALDRNVHAAAIRADMDALQGTGLRVGTPTLLVNGHMLEGAHSFDDMRARIDGLLTQ
jgi:protein-disulfide isomerase